MRRGLQVLVSVLALLPLTFGVLGLLFGVGFYVPVDATAASLDSQFRFASGWDVGLALVIWWIAPRVERHGGLFRVVCVAVCVGGLGRVASWAIVGPPNLAFRLVTFVEVAVPLLIPWQAAVARRAGRTDDAPGRV